MFRDLELACCIRTTVATTPANGSPGTTAYDNTLPSQAHLHYDISCAAHRKPHVPVISGASLPFRPEHS